MKITFEYNTEKDIWCLLNYGKKSNNSNQPTKVFERLTSKYGENPTDKEVLFFIENYFSENNIHVQTVIEHYQEQWNNISNKYIEKAESIFKISLVEDIVSYLTVNNRCSYRISENFFFVNFSTDFVNKIVMHELWHFYTWYKFGVTWEEKMGKEQYNDLKEALTVLLNVECKDLLPEGVEDVGYPQHRELRERILKFWDKEKDIEKLWESLV